MKHTELVNISAKWLKKHYQNGVLPNCPIVSKELKTLNGSGEIPDIMGFCNGASVMLEIKVNKADFLNDHKKRHRKADYGMGNYKYYVCPYGLIHHTELPDKWGLIYFNADGSLEIAHKGKSSVANLRAERDYLYSMLRRK